MIEKPKIERLYLSLIVALHFTFLFLTNVLFGHFEYFVYPRREVAQQLWILWLTQDNNFKLTLIMFNYIASRKRKFEVCFIPLNGFSTISVYNIEYFIGNCHPTENLQSVLFHTTTENLWGSTENLWAFFCTDVDSVGIVAYKYPDFFHSRYPTSQFTHAHRIWLSKEIYLWHI